MGARRKRAKKKIGPQSPIAKAQDLLGPFNLYTRASEPSPKFNEHFFFS
jgi:hypothetical protein